jgi:hypothetical protein
MGIFGQDTSHSASPLRCRSLNAPCQTPALYLRYTPNATSHNADRARMKLSPWYIRGSALFWTLHTHKVVKVDPSRFRFACSLTWMGESLCWPKTPFSQGAASIGPVRPQNKGPHTPRRDAGHDLITGLGFRIVSSTGCAFWPVQFLATLIWSDMEPLADYQEGLSVWGQSALPT